MRILQVLGKFLACGQRECDIIARDMMRMNQRRQKTSWEHEKESFCNHIREFRTKVEYVPLAQSLCIIAVDLGVGILYLSHRSQNSHRQTAAICNTCACAAPSCLEDWWLPNILLYWCLATRQRSHQDQGPPDNTANVSSGAPTETVFCGLQSARWVLYFW